MSQANTQKGRDDLRQRAVAIIGLEDQHTDLKKQAKALKEQIKEAFEAAENNGWNAKALRQTVKEMQLEPEARQGVFAFEDEVDLYRHALGLLDETETDADEPETVEAQPTEDTPVEPPPPELPEQAAKRAAKAKADKYLPQRETAQ